MSEAFHSDAGVCARHMEAVRDSLRDDLHSQSPDKYSRFGSVDASVADIFDTIYPDSLREMVHSPPKAISGVRTQTTQERPLFPSVAMTSFTRGPNRRFSVQEFIRAFLESSMSRLRFVSPPSLLIFQNAEPNNTALPFLTPSPVIG